jgi:hypothetical protein
MLVENGQIRDRENIIEIDGNIYKDNRLLCSVSSLLGLQLLNSIHLLKHTRVYLSINNTIVPCIYRAYSKNGFSVMFENTQTGITFWTSKKMLYFQNWVTLADIWKQVQQSNVSLVMLPTWYIYNTFCRKVYNSKEKKYSYIMQIVQYTDKYGNNKTIDFNVLNNIYNIFPEITGI